MITLTSYLEQQIEKDICERHDVYSTDSLSANQLDWLREQYLRALWELIKERHGERQ